MAKFLIQFVTMLSLTVFVSSPAMAHFGMIIPSESMVMQKKDSKLNLLIGFAHPFAQSGMAMEKPLKMFVQNADTKTDLLPFLEPGQYLDKKAWSCALEIKRPGVYFFAMEPQPYFEPSENIFIIHYAKTIVGAFGEEEGWDIPLGLPMEIVPLTRPFGNYVGNVFTGQALQDGKPLANALVEVEYLNVNNEHSFPNAYFETQTLKTDSSGCFTFGIPWAGWWGFAVLGESQKKIDYKGESKNVEQGGILWLQFYEPVLKR